jgi:transcriptional regulator with XRE-family HTH domain
MAAKKTKTAGLSDGLPLKAIRIKRLLTQLEVANLAGLTPGTISRIERFGVEGARVSPTTLRRLAKALDVTPEALRP